MKVFIQNHNITCGAKSLLLLPRILYESKADTASHGGKRIRHKSVPGSENTLMERIKGV